jgi:alpha-mannosidase
VVGNRAVDEPLNVHQWPEDLEPLLASDLPRRLAVPGIVQWLELMPSPDWMCRSELMLPPLRRLLARDDLEVRPTTLRGYLDAAAAHAVERRYGLADVFHGVSLGKNGDLMRRTSRRVEASLQAAEVTATVASRFNRPYARWDVYPAWELDEGWRELLAAQHHDNDECEGLCGHVGRFSYDRARRLADDVADTYGSAIARRTAGPRGRAVVLNPLGWERDALVELPDGVHSLQRALPPFGYRVVDPATATRWSDPTEVVADDASMALARGTLRVRVGRSSGAVEQIWADGHDDGLLDEPLGRASLVRGGEREPFADVAVEGGRDALGAFVRATRRGREGHTITLTVRLAATLDAVDVTWWSPELPRPDGGLAAALATRYCVRDALPEFLHDHPYGVSTIRPRGRYVRKYPSGDWMTSPQWFESVVRPFTALGFVDVRRRGGGGLLIAHDGSQAWSVDDDGALRQVLSLYDPWDEDYFAAALSASVRLVPHRGLAAAACWRIAHEHERQVRAFAADGPGGDLPSEHALAALRPASGDGAAGIAAVALYREDERWGEHHDGYAARGWGHPVVVRLVEFEGRAAAADLLVDGSVARAARTDLLGERAVPLEVAVEGGRSRLRVTLGPHQIATIYLDVIEARKEVRDLDAKREVWAQIHRADDARAGDEDRADPLA